MDDRKLLSTWILGFCVIFLSTACKRNNQISIPVTESLFTEIFQYGDSEGIGITIYGERQPEYVLFISIKNKERIESLCRIENDVLVRVDSGIKFDEWSLFIGGRQIPRLSYLGLNKSDKRIPIGSLAINRFNTSQASISLGQRALLSWTTTGATHLSINHGVGTVTGKRDVGVTPTTTGTVTYRLTASNGAESVTQDVSIAVVPVQR